MANKPVGTKADYREALTRAENLMTAALGTPEGDMLAELTTLIEAFESEYYSLDSPDSPVRGAS